MKNLIDTRLPCGAENKGLDYVDNAVTYMYER
jgi:hypothetical protein